MDEKISGLLRVSLDSIKEMIDVDTIIGEPIHAGGATIIPVSRVRMGFLSGGSDISKKDNPPFSGGCGGTIGITPIAFLAITENEVKVLHLSNDNHVVDRVIDSIPVVVEKVKEFIEDSKKGIENK